MKISGANIIIISLYVDDLLVIGSNSVMVQQFKDQMMEVFEMTDLGVMSYFLGMEILQSHQGIFIGQQKKCKFNMENCKPISTPLMQNVKLSKDQGGEKVDERLYRSLIGCLMYLTAIRPDIMFVVSLLSRFMHCANESHFKATKQVLR